MDNCGDTASLRLLSGANGRYRIEVESRHKHTYHGLAMVQHPDPTSRALLPDLTPLEPDRVLFTQFTTGQCRRDEVDVLKRCLRFDLAPANFGEGPLEIHVRGVEEDGRATAVQRIYRSDGSFEERDAGTLSWHAIHGHFHFDNVWRAELWEADAAGTRVGSEAVRTGSKNGFGFCDILNPWFGQRKTAAFRYTCDNPRTDLTLGGSSVGWTDVYPYDVSGNYIEVSGVRGGNYVLRLIVDPDNKLVEIDDNNNAICQPIVINNDPGDTANKTGPAYGC